MARKPNYKFERIERDRAKAAKKAAQQAAKKEKSGTSDLEKVEFDPAVDEHAPETSSD